MKDTVISGEKKLLEGRCVHYCDKSFIINNNYLDRNSDRYGEILRNFYKKISLYIINVSLSNSCLPYFFDRK